ncbi:MAG: FKBP-type peptidyl-prolyl cis-trans isomerase N-terminal domain-containing protein [Bacteroidota bacterium]
MRKYSVLFLAVLVISVYAQEKKIPSPKKTTVPQQKIQDKSVILKSVRDKMTYLVGYDVGLKMITDIQLKQLDLDSKIFMKAVNDAFDGKKPVLTDEEARKVYELFEKLMQAKPEDRLKMQQQMFKE